MKRICILRHAKAGKGHKKILDDHDRPLTSKGLEASKALATYIDNSDFTPDLIICSTSKRTRKTSEIVFKSFFPDTDIIYSSKLYLAKESDLYEIIKETSDSVNNLVVVGHNPGLHEFCSMLVSDGDKTQIRQLREHFSPGAMAIFKLSIKHWSDIKRKSGLLTNLIIPKEL